MTLENEARVLEAERQGRAVVDGWPIMVVFEFTGACNLHCFMCGFEMLRDDLRTQGRTKFTLPVETFRVIAEKAFPHISIVNPTVSGEPLMLPYFDELLDHADRFYCKLALFSNGTLLSGERLEKLMPHLASLTISFDGATKETFEHIRTGAKFDQVKRNVANFAKLRRDLGLQDQIDFEFNVTLLRENVGELPRIVEIAAANDVDKINAGYLMINRDTVLDSSPMNCPDATNRALKEARARADELGLTVQFPELLPEDAAENLRVDRSTENREPVSVPPPLPDRPTGSAERNQAPAGRETEDPVEETGHTRVETPATVVNEGAARLSGMPPEWKGKYYCNMPWRVTFIGQTGEVAPCCAPGRPVLGNIFEQDFMEIWNGPKYRELRQGFITGSLTEYCRGCLYLQEAGVMPYDADAYVIDTDG